MNTKEDIEKELKNKMHVTLCFMLSMLIAAPFIILCSPEFSWHQGTFAHMVVKSCYWICGIVYIFISIRYKMYKNNFIGFIMGLFFAPMMLLTLVLLRLTGYKGG